MYEKYDHHGTNVWVRSDLKGKHRGFCLCFSCGKFKPNQADNCPIASDTFQNCVKHGLTTPVFECPAFAPHPDHTDSGETIPLEDVKTNSILRANMASKKVLIRSREHDCFWRANCCGYTGNAWDAGVYDFVDAFDATQHCGPEKGIEYVIL